MAIRRARARVVVNYDAVADLLSEPKLVDDLRRRAERIATAAGPGHEIREDPTPTRTGVDVFTATPEAAARQARNGSLTRAIDAGRG